MVTFLTGARAPRPAATVVACACIGLLAVAAALIPARSSAATLSIAVQGNHFVDGAGQAIRLLGVDRSGSEYMCTGGGGQTFDGPTDDAAIASITAWHTNAVRVPLNEDCWLGINGLPNGQTAASYQQAIIAFVNSLHAHGQYVILDLHWNNGGTAQATGQEGMADADHAPAFWTSVATTFKGDPAVLFDLYNEPHDISWDCWKSGGCSDPVGGFMVAGMQTLLNAVRATGATQPIMVGGLGYSGDLSQWLTFKPTDPGNALVASFHTYNFSGCDVSCWNSTVKPVAANYPVVTGELGENDCAHGYIDSYMSWADQNGVSYLGWAWNTYDCGGFPSLIIDFNGTPTAFGIGLRDHLAALAGSPPLAASASASTTSGVMPLSVSFTGSASGGTPPYSYAWDFGDGSPASTSQNPTHIYASAGTFTARLTVTDGAAHTASATAPAVTVSPPTFTVAASANPAAGDAPLTVAFTASASGGTAPVSYAWTFGDGGSGSGATPSHTYSAAGSYVAAVTATDGSAQKATAQVTVTVSPAPSVSVAASPTAGDAPLTVALTASPSGGTLPYGYSWDFGDGSALSSSQNPTHLYAGAGSFTATLTLTDGVGHSASSSVVVAVAPTLAASASASPTSGPAPLSVNLSGSASGGKTPYSYSWDFGDGSPASTDQNPTHLYAGAGTYTAKLTVTDANGGTATAITPAVSVTAASLVASATASPTTGDAPLTTTLSAGATGGTPPYAYAWDLGDGTTSTEQTLSHQYGQGSFTAAVTVHDGAGHSSQAAARITVYPALSVTTSVTPTTGLAPLQVALSATAGGGLAPYTFSWDFGDGSTGSGDSTTHAFGAGFFYPSLTVHDAAGGVWSAVVATVVAVPAGGNVGGGGTGGTASPAAPATPSIGATPVEGPRAAEPSPAASRAAASGGLPGLVWALLGSGLMIVIGGLLLGVRRRGRLR